MVARGVAVSVVGIRTCRRIPAFYDATLDGLPHSVRGQRLVANWHDDNEGTGTDEESTALLLDIRALAANRAGHLDAGSSTAVSMRSQLVRRCCSQGASVAGSSMQRRRRR